MTPGHHLLAEAADDDHDLEVALLGHSYANVLQREGSVRPLMSCFAADPWCLTSQEASMPVPDFQSLMRPTLAVHQDNQPHTSANLRDRLADQLEVSAEDRAVMLPSGRQSVFSNRVAWAVTHMAQAGLLGRPARGVTQITDRGTQVLARHPNRVDMRVLSQFPEYEEFRARTKQRKGQPPPGHQETPHGSRDDLSPREAIEDVIDSAHSAVAADLLARVLKQSPAFLEQLVLRLLVKMGYGGLETATEHLGAPGDAGLDGLIRLDRLGLDVVYVQAKRYTDTTVGRPDIQAFVGALHGVQATRGIFITTSRFSREAREYAERVNARLVLIDGPELAALMIEHDCGVVVEEAFVLKQVDDNFFEEA
jgi:restriction system protein